MDDSLSATLRFYYIPQHPIIVCPDIKRTLVSMSKRTGMTVSQVVDEVLYTGLIEMHELDAPGKAPGVH